MRYVFPLMCLFFSGCSVVDFTCGSGEFGPRASLVTAKVTPEVLENLSRLCSQEAE